MVEENRGRKPISILNSETYAQVIFLISRGVNYNQEISNILKTKPPTTLEKLNILEKNKFLKTERIKQLNKKIYSINWVKIIDDFLKFLKTQKQNILSEVEKVHGKEKSLEWFEQQLRPYDYSTYDLLDNKEFIENTKNNEYLKIYFREAFKEVGRQKLNIALIDFFRFLVMRALFMEVLEDVRIHISRSSDLHKEFPKEYSDYGDFEKRHELEQNIIKKDRDLENLKQFSNLLYVCRKSVILEFANNIGIEKIKNLVLFKHFPQKEVKDFLEWCKEHEQIFNENKYLRHSFIFDDEIEEFRRFKILLHKEINNNPNINKKEAIKNIVSAFCSQDKYLDKLINKSAKNGMNAPKPNETTHKEVKEK